MSRAVTRTGQGEALGGSLRPWMKSFALWLLSPQPDGKRPKVSAQTRKASELAGVPVTKEALRWLRKRPDFQLFVQTLEGSVTEAAKESLTLAHQFYVQSHRAGLELAVAAGDYKAIPAFTVPILDRIVPKKAETNVGSKTIILNVQPDTLQRMQATGSLPDAGEIVVEAVVEATEDDDDRPV